MKKITISLMGIVISVYSYAQTEFNKGFGSIGFFISPTSAYQTYTMHDTFPLSTNPLLDNEVAKIGYQFGFNTDYNLTPRFSLLSSISFTNHGSKTRRTEVRYTSDVLGNPEPPSNDMYTEYEFIYHMYYLDVNLGARYNILNGKTKLYISPFAETNFFVDAKKTFKGYRVDGEVEVKHHDMEKEADFYSMRYSVGASLGTKFALSAKTSGFTEIRYRRMMNKVANEASQIYPYSLGLVLGISYNL